MPAFDSVHAECCCHGCDLKNSKAQTLMLNIVVVVVVVAVGTLMFVYYAVSGFNYAIYCWSFNNTTATA